MKCMFADLKDKVVVITGGCGLLGRTFVEAALKNNATVVAADISEEQLQKLSAEIKSDRLYTAKLDITSEASVKSLIADVKAKYGKIDALVNNAYPRNKAW